MAGAEIQANSAATALDGFPLDEVPGGVNVLLIGLLGLVGPAVAMRFGPLRAALVGVLGAAVFAVARAAGLQLGRDRVASSTRSRRSCSAWSARSPCPWRVGAFERERVKDLFSRFVPEAVVGEVLANADEDLRLGGENRVVTVLFSDVRGFTTFSETRAAGRGDRRAQPLPHGDERRRGQARGGTDLLHGRRDHGRVRRADGSARPRGPRAGGGPRDGGPGARGVQHRGARGGAARRLPDRRGSEQRNRDGRQRGLGTADGVHDDRGRHQHRVAAGGHDQGLGLGGLHGRLDEGDAHPGGRRPRARGRTSRCAGGRRRSPCGRSRRPRRTSSFRRARAERRAATPCNRRADGAGW